MNKSLSTLARFSVAALLTCGALVIHLSSPAFAAPPQVAAAGKSQQAAGTGTGTVVPELAEINWPPTEMRGLIERYAVDRTSLNRLYPADASPARRNRMKSFTSQWLETLARLNFDTLSLPGQVEYLLMKNHLEYESRQLDIQAKNAVDTEALVPFAPIITTLEEVRRRMERLDPPKAAETLAGLNKQVEAVRTGVEVTLRSGGGRPDPARLNKAVVNRSVSLLNGLRNTLRNWYGFYNGYDPIFTWWVDAPYKAVDKSLQDYASLLRERVLGLRPESGETAAAPTTAGRGSGASASFAGLGGRGGGGGGRAGGGQAEPGSSADIIGDPIGLEGLTSELEHEMIPYTPDELIAIANQEFAWCENEMKKASRELGYGDEWMKALEHVKTLYVEPGKQPELIRDLALEAIKYIEDKELMTVPQQAKESWRMEMMTPERQLVNPFFTGGEIISVSYPTNTMSHEQKMMSMRGNNIHFSRATVFHELIPGHHMQGFMTARYRQYRSLFGTSFWGEGWPLYWEMLFYDMNFPRSPENRIGMLFWRMHRCARIIFSLSFHLGKMSPQECIDLLVKRVGHEVENATGEVRRSFAGSYGPLYQAAYMIGGLQLRALHQELVDSGKMTNRAFHDAVLKENSMPIEMLRALLTRQKLTREYASSWKFYRFN